MPISVGAQSIAGEDLRSGLLATTADSRVVASDNPAATGYDGTNSVRFWIYDPYGLSEIRIRGVGFTRAIGSTAIGFSTQSIRFDELRLFSSSGTVAGDLRVSGASRVRIGLEIRVEYVRSSLGSAHTALGGEIGMLIRMSPSVRVGSVLGNWITNSSTESSSGGFNGSLGISIQITDSARMLTDIRKSRYFATDYRVGMEWAPVPVLKLQAGLSSNPQRLSIGITFLLKSVRFHFAVDRHTLLGNSRTAEVGFDY